MNDEHTLDDAGEHRDDTARVTCPFCLQANEIALDWGGAEQQEYEEDCQVCCRPWRVHVAFHDDGAAEVSVDPLEE